MDLQLRVGWMAYWRVSPSHWIYCKIFDNELDLYSIAIITIFWISWAQISLLFFEILPHQASQWIFLHNSLRIFFQRIDSNSIRVGSIPFWHPSQPRSNFVGFVFFLRWWLHWEGFLFLSQLQILQWCVSSTLGFRGWWSHF